MKEEFLTRDVRLLKSMMFNIYSVLKHEELGKRGKSKRSNEKFGITRHHNVMLELDKIKSSNS
jgi:hypothetical protein